MIHTGEPMELFEALLKIKQDISGTYPVMSGLPYYERTSGAYYTSTISRPELTNCKNCGAPLQAMECGHCNTRYL